MAGDGQAGEVERAGEAGRCSRDDDASMVARGWIRWAGMLAAVAAMALLAIAFSQSFSLSAPWQSAAPFDDDPGFLWDFRGIDMMAQGVIIVAAAVAVTSLLREYSVVGEDE